MRGALALALTLFFAACAPVTTRHAREAAAPPAVDAERASAKLGGLQLPFIANQGQVDPRVAFYAPTFAGTLFVSGEGALVYGLRGRTETPRAASAPAWSLTETFVDGTARPTGRGRSIAGVSSFTGRDATRWRSDVATFDEVGLGDVWPGVTVALRAHGRSVEKVFTVAPGAAVDGIRVRMGGAEALRLDDRGALVARTGVGDVAFTAPVAYQERHGARQPVAVAYRLRGEEYGFRVGAYDRTRPLIIDPLIQSTYLDVSWPYALRVSPVTGDVYVAGWVLNGSYPGPGGGAQTEAGGSYDGFVARLNSTLTTLLQFTFLGGSNTDWAVALDISPTTGDVYAAGWTLSTNFPGTDGGAQPASGGVPHPGGGPFGGDGFVARLNAGLTSLLQATYLGGSGDDGLHAVTIDATTGDVYVAGKTASTNMPGTEGAAQPGYGGGEFDAFVARLSGTLTLLVRTTYLGGASDDAARAIVIEPASGDVYVAGVTGSGPFPGTTGGAQPGLGGGLDLFVARLAADLSAVVQATYVGGSSDEGFLSIDLVVSLAVSPTTGDVYVAGVTHSTDLPGTAGAAQPAKSGEMDGFVARLNAALTSLVRATYFGGPDRDEIAALAIHPHTGDVYLTGTTNSNLPGVVGGVQPTYGGSIHDGFVARFTADLATLAQATYLGTADQDRAFGIGIVPASGSVYVTGRTTGNDFPGTAGGAQSGGGGFVARLTRSLAALTFADVPASHPFLVWIEALSDAGITGGCATSPRQYCADAEVTREQMAVFLLRGVHGAGYEPPAATGLFVDVPTDDLFAPWVEQLAHEGITTGCSSEPRYCPDVAVTRAQMAVFLLRAKHGAGYEPPPATGLFADVPPDDPFAPWIEQLASEGITGGCATDPARYCPGAPVTRGQMAIFLVRAFDLPI